MTRYFDYEGEMLDTLDEFNIASTNAIEMASHYYTGGWYNNTNEPVEVYTGSDYWSPITTYFGVMINSVDRLDKTDREHMLTVAGVMELTMNFKLKGQYSFTSVQFFLNRCKQVFGDGVEAFAVYAIANNYATFARPLYKMINDFNENEVMEFLNNLSNALVSNDWFRHMAIFNYVHSLDIKTISDSLVAARSIDLLWDKFGTDELPDIIELMRLGLSREQISATLTEDIDMDIVRAAIGNE